jgi:diguanylate cyclase (GGDEF)-like protein
VVSCFSPQIFPDLAGSLYVLNDSRTHLSKVGAWLEPRHATDAFPSSACWGLRRGRPHLSYHRADDIACPHLSHGNDGGEEAEEVACLCVPLTAQGDTIGLLCFEQRDGHAMAPENSRLYLEMIAENIGHDTGDKVMQYVAQIMLDTIGAAGTCYRFGGEEFTVLLQGMADTDVFDLAERLREKIATTPLSHGGRILGMVSVSIGVAEAISGGAVSTLVTRADAALYEAKSRGRNQTVTARAMMLAHDNERVVS